MSSCTSPSQPPYDVHPHNSNSFAFSLMRTACNLHWIPLLQLPEFLQPFSRSPFAEAKNIWLEVVECILPSYHSQEEPRKSGNISENATSLGSFLVLLHREAFLRSAMSDWCVSGIVGHTTTPAAGERLWSAMSTVTVELSPPVEHRQCQWGNRVAVECQRIGTHSRSSI